MKNYDAPNQEFPTGWERVSLKGTLIHPKHIPDFAASNRRRIRGDAAVSAQRPDVAKPAPQGLETGNSGAAAQGEAGSDGITAEHLEDADQIIRKSSPYDYKEKFQVDDLRVGIAARLRCPAMVENEEFVQILEGLVRDWKTANGLNPDEKVNLLNLPSKLEPNNTEISLAADFQNFFNGKGGHGFRGQDSVMETAEQIFAGRHTRDGLWQKYLDQEANTVYDHMQMDPSVNSLKGTIWKMVEEQGYDFTDKDKEEWLANFRKSFPEKASAYEERIGQWMDRYIINPTVKVDAEGNVDDLWLMEDDLAQATKMIRTHEGETDDRADHQEAGTAAKINGNFATKNGLLRSFGAFKADELTTEGGTSNPEAHKALKSKEYLANKNGLGFIRLLKTRTEILTSGNISDGEKVKRLSKYMQALRTPIHIEANLGGEIITLDLTSSKQTGNIMIGSSEKHSFGSPQTTDWEIGKNGEMDNEEESAKLLLILLTRLSELEIRG